jgi:type VI secretion system protein VasG
MAEISRTALFGKLGPLAYKAIEGATVFCKLRGNPYVELQHWITQILNAPDSDLHRIIRHYELDAAALAADITRSLDRLPRGASSISDLSSFIENAVERGWVYGSLMFGERQIRTGHLLVGMLKTPSLRGALLAISKQFERIKLDDLCDRFAQLLSGSPEEGQGPSDSGAAPGEASGAIAPAEMGKQEALKRFTTDLTEQARSGKMDPIVGRDDEIRQVVDILMRRRQNNPILVGEAGVGKTAVVEGFAQRIVRGDVPPSLKDVELRALDVGLLQAGASMKGEFEQRLRSVIDEVQASAKPIILFIDETHTLVGAGGAAGTGDAANLLKPALARGTAAHDRRHHLRRVQEVHREGSGADPPLPERAGRRAHREEGAVLMMRGVARRWRSTKVQILDEALEAAVKLGHRYIPARQLPDKSVSLLDTACARVAVSLHATPPEVDDCRQAHRGAADRAGDHRPRKAIGIETRHAPLRSSRNWAPKGAAGGPRTPAGSEKALVDRLCWRCGPRCAVLRRPGGGHRQCARSQRRRTHRKGRSTARAPRRSRPAAAPEQREATLASLRRCNPSSRAARRNPLILPTVDYQAVASVVADWTGIPVGRMAANEIETVLGCRS